MEEKTRGDIEEVIKRIIIQLCTLPTNLVISFIVNKDVQGRGCAPTFAKIHSPILMFSLASLAWRVVPYDEKPGQ